VLVGASPARSAPPANDARRIYAVGVASETLTDPTRPPPEVPALGIAAVATRTIPVTVWYPARGPVTPEPTRDAPVAHGRFPLIVYAPGNGALGANAPALVRSWAAHGYVIVAPDFPVSSRARSNLDAIDDWANQPGDIRFLLDRALGDGIAGLRSALDRGRVGLAGHSLGAMTVLAAAFGADADPRVDAVTTFAGIPLLGGTDVSSRETPLLLVHGDDDRTIPVQQSRTMFDAAAGPRVLVTIAGGGHSPYLYQPDPETAKALATATTTFWDATLRHRSTGAGWRGDPDTRLLGLAVPGRIAVEVGPAPNLPALGRR